MSQAGFLGTGINPNLFVQVIDGNTGSATPVAGVVNIIGAGNITTTGAGDTLTITLVGTTNHAVQVGNASGSLTSIGVGTTGQVLTGVTGADPVFASPAASSISITGDSGGAQTGNAFTFTGGTTGLTFAGAADTFTLGGDLVVANGGTGAVTFTSHGVLLGNTTSPITATVAGTTGQVLTGVTGSAPVFAAPATSGTVTSITAGTGITLTPSPITSTGSVALTIPVAIANGGTNATSFAVTDGTVYFDGTRLVTVAATGSAGQILTSNGIGLAPSFQPGAGSTITISTDTGGPTTSGSFTLNGGTTGLTTNAVGTTISLGGDLVVANGGTGRATLTNHGVLVGAGTAAITQLAVGATNTVLLGNTAADPSFGAVPNAALANSSITLSNGNNITVTGSPVSLGGTASFNLTGTTAHAVQIGNAGGSLTSIAVGTTGQVLTGVSGADPVWASPATSGTVTSITAGTGITLTPSPITSTGSIALTVPVVVSSGGTGAITLTSNGVLLGNGTSPVTATAAGTTGQVLTGVTGSAPTFQSPASSSISITGDTGGALTGTAFTFAGGTTGLSFGGSGSTETLTFAGITANGGTVSLATDATTSTINVGTGAGAKTSTFGSASSTSATTVQSGSGVLNVTATGGALTINSGTGALGISTDASATTVSFATGGAVKTVTLGSTNSTSGTTIQSGSGNIAHNAGFTVDSTGRNYNTVQPAFQAYLSASVSNVTGDGTPYTVAFNTTDF